MAGDGWSRLGFPPRDALLVDESGLRITRRTRAPEGAPRAGAGSRWRSFQRLRSIPRSSCEHPKREPPSRRRRSNAGPRSCRSPRDLASAGDRLQLVASTTTLKTANMLVNGGHELRTVRPMSDYPDAVSWSADDITAWNDKPTWRQPCSPTMPRPMSSTTGGVSARRTVRSGPRRRHSWNVQTEWGRVRPRDRHSVRAPARRRRPGDPRVGGS